MELQWPLILFTSFVAASAGLFCAQGVYALAGKGSKAQVPATICSIALLAIGGVAVFFHLTHPDRLFNGFGHITSGITQELIAIVVVGILMVLFLVMGRRGVPKWLGILAVVAAVALVLVMGHSYMVSSRPAWNSVLQPLSLLGAAAAIGIGAFAALAAADEGAAGVSGPLAIAGTALNLVCTAAYAAVMGSATGAFANVGNYFDPTHPTAGMTDPASFSPFAGGSMGLTVGAIALAALALVLAFVGARSKKWGAMGWGIACCALVGAILLRMAFYNAGGSVFLFY